MTMTTNTADNGHVQHKY